MSRFVIAAVLALVICPAGVTVAAEGEQVVVNTDARAIVAQQHEIREKALAGVGRYGDLDERDRRRLLSEQDKVLRMLEGKERSTELSEIDQMNLFNALESIWAIVNQAEDERIVCERVRRTGTNRAQRVCMTVAQRRENAERSRRSFDDVRSNTHKCDRGGCPQHGEAAGWR